VCACLRQDRRGRNEQRGQLGFQRRVTSRRASSQRMLRTMAQDVFGIVGTTQGPFTIEEAVAEGGFGVVYRAIHGAFRASVALKCLKIPNIPEAQRAIFLERFREEAEMLFRLSANIPEVVRPLHYDVITLPTGLIVPFIALEWLDGRTLWTLIEERAASKQKPLDCLEAGRILTPVARALEVAHRFPAPSGTICVVHRDIKPANIFLTKMRGVDVIKILDFGIAQARDNVSVIAGQMTHSSDTAMLAFTPRYGAPEQWAPKRFGTTGPWTDVWGLAITYLELLAGRAAIDGDPVAIMGTVLDEKRRPTPRTEGVRVPDVIENVMQRALALHPRDRFADAGAFWDEMEQALSTVTRSYSPASRRAPMTRPPSGGYAAVVPGAVPTETEVLPDIPRSVTASRVATLERAALDLRVDVDVPPPSRRSDATNNVSSNVSAGIDLAPVSRTSASTGVGLSLGVDIADTTSPATRRNNSPPRAALPPPSEHEHLPSSHSSRATSPSLVPEPAPEVGTMLGVPVALAGGGVFVRVLDYVMSNYWLHVERVDIGPLRLTWVAGILIGAGAFLALARLIQYLARG
jgi:eukaryotic-like serine/threonine-protein kinase